MTADNWAWVVLPAMALGFGAYLLGKLLTRAFSIGHLPVALAILGASLGIIPSAWVYRSFARDRVRTLSDTSTGDVEVVDVTDPTFVTQEEYNDEGPIYYLDIGQNKVLILWGQWVYDPHVFPGSAWHSGSHEDETLFPFPCSRFRLHRLPEFGRVLRVDLLGTPIKPIKVLEIHDIALSGLRESEVLDGTLDELSSIIKRASELRDAPH